MTPLGREKLNIKVMVALTISGRQALFPHDRFRLRPLWQSLDETEFECHILDLAGQLELDPHGFVPLRIGPGQMQSVRIVCNSALEECMDELMRIIELEDQDRLFSITSNRGVPIDTPLSNGRTPLSHAAQRGKLNSCRYLIKACGASISARNRTGRTALMEMIRERGTKWPKPIAALLRRSVNERDDSGMTAIMYASKGAGVFGSHRGNLTIIQQLIDFGARLDITCNNGLTVVGVAQTENLASNAGANEAVVDFLKMATIQEKAMQEFSALYHPSFDVNGVLLLRRR